MLLSVVSDQDASCELNPAIELLQKLIKHPDISSVFDADVQPSTRSTYTHAVTIWMLMLQRMGKGLSLSKVVSQVLNFQRDILPDGKRVRDDTLSENTSAYSKARQRLPLKTVFEFSHAVCDHLGRNSPSFFDNRRVFIIDGTTITLPPTPELQKCFPPAVNQYGRSIWPVAMLLVAHELQTGCALLPQIDPMYGDQRSCEAKQARAICPLLPEKSIILADSNFGIFSTAYYASEAGHDFLFRLTAPRFGALLKHATLQDSGTNWESYSVQWKITRWVINRNPDIPPKTAMEVIIHRVTMPSGESLYLVSSLKITGQCAGELYLRRYDVEFDIRDVKVTMDTENIRAKSASMVMKELLTSIVAFNMVAQFRRQAARLAQVEPRALSFTGVWTSFQYGLLLKEPATQDQWHANYVKALISASRRLLPKRTKPRSYPRQAHKRAQKNTKYQKPRAQTEQPPPPLT